MYEAVTPHPEGDTTPSRYATTAARMGYAGVVVLASDGVTHDPPLGAVAEEAGIDVVDAVVVDGDSVGSAVRRHRPDRTLVCVRGGDVARNRRAVEDDRVDVLLTPMTGDGDVNHVLADLAAQNGVRIAFDLGPALRATGGHRVQALRDLRKLREVVDDRDAPFVVSASARSHLQVRAPRDLAAVGAVVGFDAETIRTGLTEWGRLAERNRHRQSESFIMPGVERGKYEEDA
jgi:ribonuclease P/MRP protein subunit RPP1